MTAVLSATVRRLSRRSPTWLPVVLGAGLVVLGIALAVRPNLSMTALVVLVACGFAAAAVARLVSAAGEPSPWPHRLVAGLLLLPAVLALVWPGATVPVLSRLIAVGLLGAGVGGVLAGVRGRAGERLAAATAGVAGIGFGAVLLLWPRVTLFLTGVAFGAWLVYLGVWLAFTAVPHRLDPERPADGSRPAADGSRRSRRLRAVGATVALALSVALFAGTVYVRAGSPAVVPDAFYTPPRDVPGEPGRLIRSETFARGVPAGARAWRILYTTTTSAGDPAVASGVVLAPARPRPGNSPVLSVAHGTTGIMPGCAPSVLSGPLDDGAGAALERMVVRHGWVGVITDYVGLGTAGPHPYLVGRAAAHNVLDATRAASGLRRLRLDPRTVVWGHSQGGHAAIWTGILGPSYAPELEIVGVAAAAPATDLVSLASGVKNTTFGRIVSAYLALSWDAYYRDLDIGTLVDRRHRTAVRRVGERCFTGGRDTLAAVAITSQMFGPIVPASALSGRFGELLRANTPDAPVRAPLLVAQGGADPLVLPGMQRGWVARRCAAGQRIDFRQYPDLDHLSLVAADSPLTGELVAWTLARLAGRAATDTC
jgi:uncharacterized membrane protein HdeD (DUF308 family)